MKATGGRPYESLPLFWAADASRRQPRKGGKNECGAFVAFNQRSAGASPTGAGGESAGRSLAANQRSAGTRRLLKKFAAECLRRACPEQIRIPVIGWPSPSLRHRRPCAGGALIEGYGRSPLRIPPPFLDFRRFASEVQKRGERTSAGSPVAFNQRSAGASRASPTVAGRIGNSTFVGRVRSAHPTGCPSYGVTGRSAHPTE